MYHTEPPTDKTIREWYVNSSRVAACALRNEQAVRAYGPGRPVLFASHRGNDPNLNLLSSSCPDHFGGPLGGFRKSSFLT